MESARLLHGWVGGGVRGMFPKEHIEIIVRLAVYFVLKLFKILILYRINDILTQEIKKHIFWRCILVHLS